MPKKNVTINLDVDEIYTKEVKQDSKKGGKIYIHRDLVGKRVVVLSLRNGNKKTEKVGAIGRCEKCGKREAITIIHYQRLDAILNGEVCMCDPKDPCSYGFLKKYYKDNPRVKKLLNRLENKKK